MTNFDDAPGLVSQLVSQWVLHCTVDTVSYLYTTPSCPWIAPGCEPFWNHQSNWNLSHFHAHKLYGRAIFGVCPK